MAIYEDFSLISYLLVCLVKMEPIFIAIGKAIDVPKFRITELFIFQASLLELLLKNLWYFTFNFVCGLQYARLLHLFD